MRCLLWAALGLTALAPASCDSDPDPGDRVTTSKRAVHRVNLSRAEHGLPPYRYSRRLTRACRRHSLKMWVTRNFAHATGFRGPWSRASEAIACSASLPWRRAADSTPYRPRCKNGFRAASDRA